MTYPPQKQTGDVIDTGLFDLLKGIMQKLQRKSKKPSFVLIYSTVLIHKIMENFNNFDKNVNSFSKIVL